MTDMSYNNLKLNNIKLLFKLRLEKKYRLIFITNYYYRTVLRKYQIFYNVFSTQYKRVLTKTERQVFIMNLKPLGDRVILKHQEAEEKTQSGIILPDSAKEKPQAAIVVAVGPGKEEDGHKIEMQVKEGDKVIYSKYSGTEVKYGDEEYTIVSQNDIIAIVE
jgi:chaperonin GroES